MDETYKSGFLEMSINWEDENVWEKRWWGNCANTFVEECKQFYYSGKMGLKWENNGFINLQGKSVLDIGGGPVSLLLKTHNSKVRTVVDPCHFPNWVNSRYNCAGVLFRSLKGEQILDWIEFNFDEVWMYNVLLHVQDPVKVINNAKAKSKIIRVVEYIHTEIQPGHPHTFTPKQLDEYFGGIGDIDNNPPSPVNSPIWYGVFKGDNYEKI